MRAPLSAPAPAGFLALLAFVLAACLSASGAAAASRYGGDIDMSADGRTLLRDCRPWYPRGLSFFGRLIPRGWQSDPGTMAAQADFGQRYIDAVKAMGGDVARLQVGMPFLDPQSPQFNPGYVDELRSAVDLARRKGLSVILSMQWQRRTTVTPVETKPGASALRAWRALAPAFADDQGVMLELFNEPMSAPRPTARDWEEWRQGHQAIIDELRGKGDKHVLIVEGLNAGKTLEGAPELRDPLRKLAFGLHPYLVEQLDSPAEWEARFGRFADQHAVIATEWSHRRDQCARVGIGTMEQLLRYLESKRIGVIAYGADERVSRIVKVGPDAIQTTTFRGRECDAPGAGPGDLLRDLFQRNVQPTGASPAVSCRP